MFQLLQPTWLFAISGIIVPIAIHLWNNRQGKTLQVGSIFLLQENATKKARSLRLTDILLLLIRCLLIILLAFLLAKPVWKKQLTSYSEKGWVMIEKNGLQETYKNFKLVIDSLIRVGYKFHYFNKDFVADEFEDALKTNADLNSNNELPYWTLLKQLNEQVPTELPIYLFTDNRLNRFEGTRPEVSLNIKWSTYTKQDTSYRSLVKAYKTSADSIRLIISNSKAALSFYASAKIPANGNSQYKVSKDENKIVIRSANKIDENVELDTSSLNILIYTDQFFKDAEYLKSAINAIQEYTQRKINVSIINDAANIGTGNDWLFWLSEKPLPFKNLPSNVFLYEKGKERLFNSWVATVNAQLSLEPVPLFRRIDNSSENNFGTIWKDGFGKALLDLENTRNNIYHFYSRFNPEWNDLVWNSRFVEMIFDLLNETDRGGKNFDKRIIDDGQLQPKIIKNKTFDKEKFVETREFSKLFWIIAFIVFCIERYLSLTSRKPVAYA